MILYRKKKKPRISDNSVNRIHPHKTYQTARGISAAIASSIPLAAKGGLMTVSKLIFSPNYSWINSYGTKRAVAVAPVSFTASLTFAKTGRSRWVVPAFLGLVPPTTLVPRHCQQ